MGADYRDGLAAAHARIAELEDKVRALEADLERPDPGSEIRFPELEAVVEHARPGADAKRSARRQLIVQLTGAAIAISGAVFSFLSLPLVASCMSVIFLATVVAGFVMRARLKKAKRALAEATQRLADARRVELLEQKLAAVTGGRARVELDGDRDEPIAEAEADPTHRTTMAR